MIFRKWVVEGRAMFRFVERGRWTDWSDDPRRYWTKRGAENEAFLLMVTASEKGWVHEYRARHR